MHTIERYRAAGSVYAGALERFDAVARKFEKRAPGPEAIARAIHRAIRARRSRARYVAPFSASLLVGFVRMLPTRWADALFGRMAHLSRAKMLPAGAAKPPAQLRQAG